MLRVPSSIGNEQFESLKIQEATFVAYRSDVYPARNEIFFEEHAVVFVLAGEKKFSAPHQSLHVRKGQILFFQRGCYSMSESIDSEYQSLVFFFNEVLLKEFVNQNPTIFDGQTTQASTSILVLESTPTLGYFVDAILGYFRNKTPFLNQFLRLKSQELLLHLLETDTSNQFKNTLFRIFQGQKTELDYLMATYYLKPLSIGELARMSGRSLSAFKREFQDHFQTSPAVWIKAKRLERAAFLLKNTPKNVSEVCMEVGYESVSHFIKAYKEKYGQTPTGK